VTLTEPRGRSLRLTGAGSHLADAAAIAEDVLRSGEEISRWLGTTAPATVRLALDFLDRAPWFDLFGGTGRFPFRVDLVRVGFRGVVEAVARHVVDAGIVVVPDHEEEGQFVIARDELAAAVPTDHPAVDRGALLPEEIEEMTYLTTGGDTSAGIRVLRLHAARERLSERVRAHRVHLGNPSARGSRQRAHDSAAHRARACVQRDRGRPSGRCVDPRQVGGCRATRPQSGDGGSPTGDGGSRRSLRSPPAR
jgi:hypothetical protein